MKQEEEVRRLSIDRPICWLPVRNRPAVCGAPGLVFVRLCAAPFPRLFQVAQGSVAEDHYVFD